MDNDLKFTLNSKTLIEYIPVLDYPSEILLDLSGANNGDFLALYPAEFGALVGIPNARVRLVLLFSNGILITFLKSFIRKKIHKKMLAIINLISIEIRVSNVLAHAETTHEAFVLAS